MAEQKIDAQLEAELEAIKGLMTILEPLNEVARIHVIDFVFRRLGIPLGPQHASAPIQHETNLPPLEPSAPQLPPRQSITDILTLRQQKQPSSANEMTALVAYYLAHLAPTNERRDYIAADDIAT